MWYFISFDLTDIDLCESPWMNKAKKENQRNTSFIDFSFFDLQKVKEEKSFLKLVVSHLQI